MGRNAMNIFVRFRPGAELRYCERVAFATEYGAASILVMGGGVSPSLQVSEESIDFGSVLANDCGSKRFTLRNTSAFPLKYSIVERGSLADVPTSGLFHACRRRRRYLPGSRLR